MISVISQVRGYADCCVAPLLCPWWLPQHYLGRARMHDHILRHERARTHTHTLAYTTAGRHDAVRHLLQPEEEAGQRQDDCADMQPMRGFDTAGLALLPA